VVRPPVGHEDEKWDHVLPDPGPLRQAGGRITAAEIELAGKYDGAPAEPLAGLSGLTLGGRCGTIYS